MDAATARNLKVTSIDVRMGSQQKLNPFQDEEQEQGKLQIIVTKPSLSNQYQTPTVHVRLWDGNEMAYIEISSSDTSGLYEWASKVEKNETNQDEKNLQAANTFLQPVRRARKVKASSDEGEGDDESENENKGEAREQKIDRVIIKTAASNHNPFQYTQAEDNTLYVRKVESTDSDSDGERTVSYYVSGSLTNWSVAGGLNEEDSDPFYQALQGKKDGTYTRRQKEDGLFSEKIQHDPALCDAATTFAAQAFAPNSHDEYHAAARRMAKVKVIRWYEQKIENIVVRDVAQAEFASDDFNLDTICSDQACVLRVLDSFSTPRQVFILNWRGNGKAYSISQDKYENLWKLPAGSYSDGQAEGGKLECAVVTKFIKERDPHFFNPLLNLDLNPEQKNNITNFFGKSMLGYVTSMGKLIDKEFERVERELQAEELQEEKRTALRTAQRNIQTYIGKFLGFVEALQSTPTNTKMNAQTAGDDMFVQAIHTAAQQLKTAIAQCPEIKNEATWWMSRILGMIVFAAAGVGIALGAAPVVLVGAGLLGTGIGFFAGNKMASKLSPTLGEHSAHALEDVEKRGGRSPGV